MLRIRMMGVLVAAAVLISAGGPNGTAHADNPKCAGSKDCYEGSKCHCTDARLPRESKFPKRESQKKAPPEPAPPPPKGDTSNFKL